MANAKSKVTPLMKATKRLARLRTKTTVLKQKCAALQSHINDLEAIAKRLETEINAGKTSSVGTGIGNKAAPQVKKAA